ncbi:hypothetical protein Tco_1277251 [Tanacetum coccineum]
MLVQGPILQGKGSTVPVESHHTPSGAPQPHNHQFYHPQGYQPNKKLRFLSPQFSSLTPMYRIKQHSQLWSVSWRVNTTVTSNRWSHTLEVMKGHYTLHELTVLCTKFPNNVDMLKRVSEDEKNSEDTSKQGRMIEDIDQDAGIYLVTPTKVSSQEDQFEDQLGVLSASKVLADATKKNVNTYTRRRRAVSTTGASMPVSTAGKAIMQESEKLKKIKKRVQIQMSLDEELTQKLHKEEQARFNAKQRSKV